MTSAQIAAYRENGRFNTLTPDADAKIFPGKSLEEEASLIAALSRKLEETKGNDMIQAYLAMRNDIQKALLVDNQIPSRHVQSVPPSPVARSFPQQWSWRRGERRE